FRCAQPILQTTSGHNANHSRCDRKGQGIQTKRLCAISTISELFLIPLTLPLSSMPSRPARGVRADAQRLGRDAVLAGGEDVYPPPSGPRSKRCGELGPASSGHRETRKRTDTAVARRVARRIAYRCVGPKGQGSLPNQKPGGSESNPDHASSRRAIPL